MKNKSVVIGIFVIIVSLSAAALLLTGAVNNGSRSATSVRVIALERQDFEHSVSATGIVYSAQSTEIHSTLNFPVETVKVQVGDRISEGDVLAVLDMSSLEMSIEQHQASLRAAQASANQNLAAARNERETLRRNLETGNDFGIATARFAVSGAQAAVRAAEVEVNSANRNLSNARRDLRDYRRAISGTDDWFDPALSQLRGSVIAFETALATAQNNLQIAIANLAKAEESYAVTMVYGADALVSLENMVSAAQLSTNFNDQQIAIQNLQHELEKAEILSPVSGAVTAVIAEEGALGFGLLFVIQDPDNLVIKTNINEIDFASVDLGNRVNIRADATGSAVFNGTLTRIAPTSMLMTYGSNQHRGYAKFESEVAVFSGSELKIGMNTRLSIITQQRNNVFVVPFEAVTADGVVYVATPQENGSYIAEAFPVTTGIKVDRRIEISANALTDGALIIRNAEGVQAGTLVIPYLS